jgi:lipopolysaccharide transport system permease protein
MDITSESISTKSPEIEIKIEPSAGWRSLNLGEIWPYRELLYFLTWRDIRVRYKQTILGAAWAILQPLVTMILFTIIFGVFARLPSQGIPYPLFTYTALLPWQLFSYALSQSSSSLVADKNLITKVYFPRLIIPVSSILSGVFDFAIAFPLWLILMLIYRIPWTWRILTLPIFIFLALLTALAVGLWLSALNVKYRDVRYTLPFLTQFWMYATPIAYSATIVPEQWRWLYSLNPMTGVVEGFRWALLGTANSLGLSFVISIIATLIIFTGGIIYFKRMEDSFADLV